MYLQLEQLTFIALFFLFGCTFLGFLIVAAGTEVSAVLERQGYV